MEITTHVTFKICLKFYSIIGNADFPEFSCIINLLILFAFFFSLMSILYFIIDVC